MAAGRERVAAPEVDDLAVADLEAADREAAGPGVEADRVAEDARSTMAQAAVEDPSTTRDSVVDDDASSGSKR